MSNQRPRVSTGFYGRTLDGGTPFYGSEPAKDARQARVASAGQRLETPVPKGMLRRDNVGKQNWTWSKAHMLVGDTDRKKFSPNGDPFDAEDGLRNMQGWADMANEYAIAKIDKEIQKKLAAKGDSPNNAISVEDMAEVEALIREKVRGKRKAYETRFHNEFAHRFREWVRGNGSDEEYKIAGMLSYVEDPQLGGVGDKCKKGKNTPISDHPSVLEYLAQWQDRVIDYEKKKTIMKLRGGRSGPRGEAASLNDLWMLWKFGIYGGPEAEDPIAAQIERAARVKEERPPTPPPRTRVNVKAEPGDSSFNGDHWIQPGDGPEDPRVTENNRIFTENGGFEPTHAENIHVPGTDDDDVAVQPHPSILERFAPKSTAREQADQRVLGDKIAEHMEDPLPSPEALGERVRASADANLKEERMKVAEEQMKKVAEEAKAEKKKKKREEEEARDRPLIEAVLKKARDMDAAKAAAQNRPPPEPPKPAEDKAHPANPPPAEPPQVNPALEYYKHDLEEMRNKINEVHDKLQLTPKPAPPTGAMNISKPAAIAQEKVGMDIDRGFRYTTADGAVYERVTTPGKGIGWEYQQVSPPHPPPPKPEDEVSRRVENETAKKLDELMPRWMEEAMKQFNDHLAKNKPNVEKEVERKVREMMTDLYMKQQVELERMRAAEKGVVKRELIADTKPVLPAPPNDTTQPMARVAPPLPPVVPNTRYANEIAKLHPDARGLRLPPPPNDTTQPMLPLPPPLGPVSQPPVWDLGPQISNGAHPLPPEEPLPDDIVHPVVAPQFDRTINAPPDSPTASPPRMPSPPPRSSSPYRERPAAPRTPTPVPSPKKRKEPMSKPVPPPIRNFKPAPPTALKSPPMSPRTAIKSAPKGDGLAGRLRAAEDTTASHENTQASELRTATRVFADDPTEENRQVLERLIHQAKAPQKNSDLADALSAAITTKNTHKGRQAPASNTPAPAADPNAPAPAPVAVPNKRTAPHEEPTVPPSPSKSVRAEPITEAVNARAKIIADKIAERAMDAQTDAITARAEITAVKGKDARKKQTDMMSKSVDRLYANFKAIKRLYAGKTRSGKADDGEPAYLRLRTDGGPLPPVDLATAASMLDDAVQNLVETLPKGEIKGNATRKELRERLDQMSDWVKKSLLKK